LKVLAVDEVSYGEDVLACNGICRKRNQAPF